tara:strand:- start:384 stop:788 length:405 start_codon:yes stop_codon:yes gene_type:complete
MEDEFYSIIKLITGEEIIAKVCYVPEDDVLFLDQPMRVEPVKQRKNGHTVDGFALIDWLHATYDKSFILPMDSVLTMSELDKRIERYYLSFIDGSHEEDDNPGQVPTKELSTKNGYLGSINETKKVLEKIFKSS